MARVYVQVQNALAHRQSTLLPRVREQIVHGLFTIEVGSTQADYSVVLAPFSLLLRLQVRFKCGSRS